MSLTTPVWPLFLCLAATLVAQTWEQPPPKTGRHLPLSPQLETKRVETSEPVEPSAASTPITPPTLAPPSSILVTVPAVVAPPAIIAEEPKVLPAQAVPLAAERLHSIVHSLNLHNASLTEVIDQLARMLKINYILDPRVKGGVYLNTYGEMQGIDAGSLLDIILRINGFGMVQVGDIHRIVPLSDLSHMPVAADTKTNSKDIPTDDEPMLNLVFLKYATVDELAKVLKEFTGEGARMITYSPANLLFILDSHRNMRRTMDLISMFDSDLLTNQRVRLFETKNGRPSDIAQELSTILKNVALSEKPPPIRFLPVDRINTIIAVAPNPGVFDTVESWLKKLDVPIKSSGGGLDTYVYRLKYGRAECLGIALMQLYGSFSGGAYGMGLGYGGMGYGGALGNSTPGTGPTGAGATIGGANAGLGSAGGCGGIAGSQAGAMGYGMGMGGYGGYPTAGGYGSLYPGGYTPQYAFGNPMPGTVGPGQAVAPGASTNGDLTGAYLGAGKGNTPTEQAPRIVPNPLDNSLLIQASANQYHSIVRLLDQLDLPPRQILLEAKIYEVSLTGAFASGVTAVLQKLGAGTATLKTHQLQATLAEGSTLLTAGTLVGASRELLAFVSLQENATRARVLSAPSLIATDSIAASITVGNEVPTLTAQAAGNVQVGGNSTFTQSIQTRQTGVTLNVMAHINPSGIVTLIINQEVSAPEPPSAASSIQSPSFSKRSVQTQITMHDGDTIAIGGIINESTASSTAGIPGLNRLPIIGAAFGNRSYSKDRTELIVFMTPHVIYDNNDLLEASDELKARLRKLRKYVAVE